MNKVAVILAGGYGSRMWPRSTEKMPKQFNHFIGEGTMLQNTVERLLPLFSSEDIYIVTEKKFREECTLQLPMISEKNILLEPFARKTAPAVALAATLLTDKYGEDAVMYAFPSDHIIHNVREFHQSLELAGHVAWERKGKITIGITPTRPETGYGYIQIKESPGELGELFDQGVRYSTTFAEKPDLETAKRFIGSGDFLWNSGIFVWRFDTFISGFNKYLPEHAALFRQLSKHKGKDTYETMLDQVYMQIQAESVDYAILEKSENVLVLQASFAWSDLGNWDEFYRLSMKDGRNNFIEGNVISVNTKNCLVSGKEKLISIVGLQDIIVIDSEEALLICPRKQSEEVKEIVKTMRRKNINHYL